MHAVAATVAAIVVNVAPASANPDAQVSVHVSGLQARSALVVLHGGIASRGRWFKWVPLQRAGSGAWSAVLKTPGLLGVYPVHVRADGRVVATSAMVQIVPPGFGRQPGFEEPAQVAQWWAWIAKPGIVVQKVTPWNAGFYSHRDPSFNRLLRVQFKLLSNWPEEHLRAGPHVLYLSVARAAPNAGWRLLQTLSAP